MNPTPFLRGAPLVEVRGVTDEEREAFRNRAHAFDRYVHLAWRMVLALGFFLVLPLVTGALPIGTYLVILVLVTLLNMGIAARLEYCANVLRQAANSDQRWIFHGRAQDSSSQLLVPGWVTESSEGFVRKLDSRLLAWVDSRRGRLSGPADSLEAQELKYRHGWLLTRSTVQALAVIPLGVALAMVTTAGALTWVEWLLAAGSFLIGAEGSRRAAAGLLACWRMAREAEKPGPAIYISAATAEMQDASARLPELLGCLHGIEVLPSRLLWSVDGRPARWRVQSTVPTFVPKRLVLPCPAHRSLVSRLKLLPKRVRP